MQVIIPYKPNKIVMFGVAVFFGVCGVVLGNIAVEGQTALSLFRIVRLEPDDAVVAFWVMSIISILFALAAVFFVVYSIANPKEIAFMDKALKFPKNVLGNDYLYIKYDDIGQGSEMSVRGTYIYTVPYSSGKIVLTTSMVPGKKYYEQFKSELAARVKR